MKNEKEIEEVEKDIESLKVDEEYTNNNFHNLEDGFLWKDEDIIKLKKEAVRNFEIDSDEYFRSQLKAIRETSWIPLGVFNDEICKTKLQTLKECQEKHKKFVEKLKERLKYEMVEKESFIGYSLTAFERDIIPLIEKISSEEENGNRYNL